MFCILTDSEDPFFNLAIEEYLLKNSREEYLILGVNSQAVIIGKHQVAHRETDTRYVTENNIPVIRRISGGGTVFMTLVTLTSLSWQTVKRAGRSISGDIPHP